MRPRGRKPLGTGGRARDRSYPLPMEVVKRGQGRWLRQELDECIDSWRAVAETEGPEL
jgi:hypothetical protein